MYKFKYVKYNSSYKIKYLRKMAWYYKVNFKTDSPKLKIKNMNLAYISSSILIAKENIKQIVIYVHFKNIVLIKSSNFRKPKVFFIEHLKELCSH